MKPNFIPHIVIASLCLSLFTTVLSSCGDEPLVEEPSSSGRPLKEGEMSTVIFTNRVSSIEEITTRSIPKDKKTVLQDYANHELKGADGGNAGWISGEVRTEYGEEERQAVTRTFESSKLFGKNSQFRMLVFQASSGGDVDMTKSIANMKCQVNAEGNGASFIPEDASLVLPRGKYSFVCFPIDDKYNTWDTTQGQFEMKNDEDFVCMHLADQEISTEFTEIPLNQFVRYGYQLTVKFSVNKNLGYVYNTSSIKLTISDDGANKDSHVINTLATFNLTDKKISYTDGNCSLTNNIVVDGAGDTQTYASVSNYVIANNDVKQKLTIKYPAMMICKPASTPGNAAGAEDSVFQIKAGTYTTEEPVQFQAGKSYTITLAVGKQVPGIIVGGVIWSPGNLDYNETTGKYFWAPGPDKAKTAREVRGASFRWFTLLPQSSSNTSGSKLITTKWTVTVPNWTGNAYDLGNYNGYYKGIFGDDRLTIGSISSPLTPTSVGDPCWGMGKGWRMPTYNEIYVLLYVFPNKIPTEEDEVLSTDRKYYGAFHSYTGSFNDEVTDRDAIFSGIYITSSGAANENPDCITDVSQYDGSQLFLPAAGVVDSGTDWNYLGQELFYWTSTPANNSVGQSWMLHNSYGVTFESRALGMSVRCVLDK